MDALYLDAERLDFASKVQNMNAIDAALALLSAVQNHVHGGARNDVAVQQQAKQVFIDRRHPGKPLRQSARRSGYQVLQLDDQFVALGDDAVKAAYLAGVVVGG
jgi:hypothetical protein